MLKIIKNLFFKKESIDNSEHSLKKLQKEYDNLKELHDLKSQILFHSLDTLHTLNRNNDSLNNSLEINNAIKYAEILRHVYNVKSKEDLKIILNSIFSRKINLQSGLDVEDFLDKLYLEHINNK